MVQSCARGGLDWIAGKDSSPGDGWALEQASRASGHSTGLTEFKNPLDNTQLHGVTLGVFCAGPGFGP